MRIPHWPNNDNIMDLIMIINYTSLIFIAPRSLKSYEIVSICNFCLFVYTGIFDFRVKSTIIIYQNIFALSAFERQIWTNINNHC